MSQAGATSYLDSVLDFVAVELLGCALPRQKQPPAVMDRVLDVPCNSVPATYESLRAHAYTAPGRSWHAQTLYVVPGATCRRCTWQHR